MRNPGILTLLFALLLSGAGLLSCTPSRGNMVEITGAAWNTTYAIKFRGPLALASSVDSVLRKVELSLSVFNPRSTVSMINKNESVQVDEMFVQVFAVADSANRLSVGMFDPTISPLINAWGFGYGSKPDTEPGKQLIDSLLQCVGIGDCHIIGDSIIKKSPATSFNFSAVAKGYGVDCIARMLRERGVNDFLIEVGGEIAVSGVNERDEKWRVMIDAPAYGVGHSGLLTIPVTDCAIATSGNYRNYREYDGRRVGHTISPLTGYPVTTSTLSATVIAPQCAWADALATACMAMPADSALSMIENLKDVECLLAVQDGDTLKMVTTPGFY